jgi:cytochrome c oxidase subunit 2
VLITALVVVFVLKYRHRKGSGPAESSAGHSTTLELTWTIIPTIIVLILYYYGFRGYMQMTVEPPNAYEIVATGRMWNWTFTYPNGYQGNELHVPANVPVRVILRSEDVIHSLYIPAFRVKKDVVPGRYNRLWFNAVKDPSVGKPTDVDTYDIYCAAYCGTNHSIMLSKAVVHNADDFDHWLEAASDPRDGKRTPIQIGELIYKTRGCAQCHSVDGSKIIGPTWKDMYGSTVPLEGGGTVKADDAYVMESIAFPQAKIHQGYPNSMPAFQLKDYEMASVIAYMKSISKNVPDAEKAPLNSPLLKPEKK